MKIAVIGAGNIGGTLSGRLAASGVEVTVGVRSPGGASRERLNGGVMVAAIPDALRGADAVIVAIPGPQVPAFAAEHAAALAGKVVIDATNDLATGHDGTLNHLDAWAEQVPSAVVARAFCTLGFESFRNPDFGGQTATLFWCGPDGREGETVAAIVRAVGLDPVRIGGVEAGGTLDGLTRLWFQLVFGEKMGRHLAFKLLRDEG
jgi:8-hydroxy-5-deazaflavin:NADPH oxidoreductase